MSVIEATDGTREVKLTITKRGRKWFTCRVGKRAAKVLINDVSGDLQVDDVANVEVLDKSEKTKFGTTVIYEPVRVLEKLDSEREEALKWLTLAERDISTGLHRTNAIRRALAFEGKFSDMQDRFDELHDSIDAHAEMERMREEAEKEYELVECEPPSTPEIQIVNGGDAEIGTRIFEVKSRERDASIYSNQMRMIKDNRSNSKRSGVMHFEMPTSPGVYKVLTKRKRSFEQHYLLLSAGGKWYEIQPGNETTVSTCLQALNGNDWEGAA
ncbi:hypothetical protein [Fodinicurvata sediminis]|uniref:hypothetical protein n=1 Tax=Fodinicurvata sediminis TaxID=1121832 RepID=UPI0003B55142|nr:hypothetical protein [Fodinicurvata sediminis]